MIFILVLPIPLFIVIPSAVKYHDGIRQIASLCAYIKVFYELPSIIKRKEGGRFFWETTHCNQTLKGEKLIGAEYLL